MSNKYVEKTFLWLLACSLLLHVAAFELFKRIPSGNSPKAEQTTMVDLTDIPPPAQTVKPQAKPRQKQAPLPSLRPEVPSKVEHFAEQRQRVAREAAPRPARIAPSLPPQLPAPGVPQARKPGPVLPKAETVPAEKGATPVARGEGIFRSKSREQAPHPGLFPTAGSLARLEDKYRQKYQEEVEQGETNFLNTDDIRFGSFFRRFETAVYGVWQYPREAAQRGIEGTTPVRVTFDKKGKVVQVELLETSGSKILDGEVMRTLNEIGPIGSLPRGYPNETFKVIVFFRYINGGGWIH